MTGHADKRETIALTLRDDTWRKRTNRWIAEHLGVDHKTVSRIRAELEASGEVSGEKILTAENGRRFEVVPALNRNVPCDGCGLLPVVGCTCPSKDPDARPNFGLPGDADWWDCPLCGTTFSRRGAAAAGWVKRCFCGDCEGAES